MYLSGQQALIRTGLVEDGERLAPDPPHSGRGATPKSRYGQNEGPVPSPARAIGRTRGLSQTRQRRVGGVNSPHFSAIFRPPIV